MQSPLELLSIAALAIALPILSPWAAVAFLVNGSVIYYAALHVLGVPTSALLTGGVFAALGTVSLIRLAASSGVRFTKRRLALLGLFVLFVLIWFARWTADPPTRTSYEPARYIAERARFFMVAFAAVPFLAGVLSRRERDLARALRWVAIWGVLGLAVVVIYWATGAPSTSVLEDRWEPIPWLSGIQLSFDVGTGCVAYFSLPWTGRRRLVSASRWAVLLSTLLVMIRVGQRGPFVFLVLVLLLRIVLQPGGRLRRLAVAGLTSSVLLFAVLLSVDASGPRRVLHTDHYSAEYNEVRFELIVAGLRFAAERPFIGWGGSLVGEPLQGSVWTYSHVTLLDPLVETGLLGGVPFALLLYVLASWAWRGRNGILALPEGTSLILLVAFSLLEHQVSGHISFARHMWFSLGLLGGIVSAARTLQSTPGRSVLTSPAPSSGEASVHGGLQ